MKNRIPTHVGRIKLTVVDAENGIYDMERADEPIQEGTPLNKELLDYALAANGVTGGTATEYTLDDGQGFTLVDGAKINFRLHTKSGTSPTINVNGTGAKPLVTARGIPVMPGFPKGVWISATYSSELDAFTTSDSNSELLPTIVVNAYEGAEVTCSDGQNTIELNYNGNGRYSTTVPYFGVWDITADLEGEIETASVVVGEISTYTVDLTFFSSTLSENSWKRISLASKLGIAKTLWKVGNRRYISDDANYNDIPLEVTIIGFDHNGAENTIDFNLGYNVAQSREWAITNGSGFVMNNDTEAPAAWHTCYMRYNLLGSTDSPVGGKASPNTAVNPQTPVGQTQPTLMQRLPQDLRNVMKPIETTTYEGGSGIYSTIDYLPLMTEYEIFGTTNATAPVERNYLSQYDFYKNGSTWKKYGEYNNDVSDVPWALRSSYYVDSTKFVCVAQSGKGAEARSQVLQTWASPIFRV